jgi:hypothetical protein
MVHPGFVATGFRAIITVAWLVCSSGFAQFTALSPEQGAETLIYLATSPEVAGVTGTYFVKKRSVESSAASYDQAAAQFLLAAQRRADRSVVERGCETSAQ